jgi:hypothetical protein
LSIIHGRKGIGAAHADVRGSLLWRRCKRIGETDPHDGEPHFDAGRWPVAPFENVVSERYPARLLARLLLILPAEKSLQQFGDGAGQEGTPKSWIVNRGW